jgi:hypothetical protein
MVQRTNYMKPEGGKGKEASSEIVGGGLTSASEVL